MPTLRYAVNAAPMTAQAITPTAPAQAGVTLATPVIDAGESVFVGVTPPADGRGIIRWTQTIWLTSDPQTILYTDVCPDWGPCLSTPITDPGDYGANIFIEFHGGTTQTSPIAWTVNPSTGASTTGNGATVIEEPAQPVPTAPPPPQTAADIGATVSNVPTSIPSDGSVHYVWFAPPPGYLFTKLEFTRSPDGGSSGIGDGNSTFGSINSNERGSSYATPGTKTVTVLITYDDGSQGTRQYTYDVEAPPPPPAPPELTGPPTAANAQQWEDDTVEDAPNLQATVSSHAGTPAAEDTLQGQIDFWQSIVLTQTGDPNVPGTLLYRAVSARDFFSELADAQRANLQTGNPPQSEINGIMIDWANYSAEMALLVPAQRIGIDIWSQLPQE